MHKRCTWVTQDQIYIDYHDNEWGVRIKDDISLFECLTLEGVQAGLSWLTVLKKREAYRQAYDGFNPNQIALYDEAKQKKLLHNKNLIRHKLKIQASITNAKAFLIIQQQFKSFFTYIYSFTGDVQNIAQNMSKDLARRGFKYVGPTIIYSFMQAVGMVNDHDKDCFRYNEI